MKDLIEIMERHEVEYVLVGGFAVNFYGYVRTTHDVDILVNPSFENARKMVKALEEFGFGSDGVPAGYFETEGTAIHMGVEPNRIDLLTNLKGISNEEIFQRKDRVKFENIFLNIISFEDLLSCKKKSDRLKDLADADELERMHSPDKPEPKRKTKRKQK
ncbi:MAG: nucleotidyltransferase [Candidatus Aminicenantes bacterium]|nr:nucleotidyltransferase [Candidatus Aminicenantes bacterium]